MTKLHLVSIRKITFRAANIALSLAVLAGVLGVQSAHAQTFTVLYNFTGGTDGANPAAGLLRDAQGILYGSTGWGGAYGWGTIFKVNTSGIMKPSLWETINGESTDASGND